MKKTLLASILCLGLLTSANAYELNGDLGVKWTGFKTEKRTPVSGTFNDIKLDIRASDDLSLFLKSSMVKIQTKSLESNNPSRNLNITSTLFSLATSKEILGTISNVDAEKNSLTLNISMNGITNAVPMVFKIADNKIIAVGKIDVLDYDMKNPYLAFAQKCGALHQNKSFSDVFIEFTIPFK